MIKVLKVKEACEILKAHGMDTNVVRIEMGLRQGVYPFGTAIQMDKSWVYEVYDVLLRRWIAERSEAVA